MKKFKLARKTAREWLRPQKRVAPPSVVMSLHRLHRWVSTDWRLLPIFCCRRPPIPNGCTLDDTPTSKKGHFLPLRSYILLMKSNPPQITGSTNSIPNVILFILSCTYIFMASLLSETLHLLWIEQENQQSAKTEKSKGGNRHRFSFESIGSKQDIFLNKDSIQMFWYWYANFLFYYWYANFEFLDRASSERNSYQDFHSSFKNFQLIPRTIIISATHIKCEKHMLSKKDFNNQETTFQTFNLFMILQRMFKDKFSLNWKKVIGSCPCLAQKSQQNCLRTRKFSEASVSGDISGFVWWHL